MEAAGVVLSAGGVVLSAAQTLLASLDSAALKKFMSDLKYKSQLDDLQQTVTALRAVLLDAEAKQELSHLQEYEFEKLKDVVFEADDLLDEFATLAQQNAGVTLSEKVCSFFSEAGVARRMSQGVESIKKKLEAIDYNTRSSFKHDPEPMRRRKPETCSLVRADDIIGRKEDLEKIVGMMLDSSVQRDVSSLTIVGIGGLGKTALAQLVYNDSRVTSAFPLRLWASVSDHDQKQLDVKDILCQILASATNNEPQKDFTLEQVQKQLGHQLAGKKFLLVLDDVWSEKRDQWLNLEKFLIGGQKGSWILITTRSLKTAKIIGGSRPYELEGLSEENSRRLFERMAFGLQSSNPPDDLVKIGQDIVKRCARVPLAIRVIGSFLYGQDKTLWVSLAQNPLANLGESQNDIMPILKLSYYNLESPLKSCFSYCALFPKDHEIRKERLISLWMAQGYIVPSDGRSIEDVAEEYFSILLQRCFFQDVRTYEHIDTTYFKIHDLMHDVAQMVTKREICAIDNLEGNLNNKVRHLSVITNKGARCSLDKSHIRTYLSGGYLHPDVKALMANCIRLRALALSRSGIKTLPKSIGDLLHLRYLDLSYNHRLEELPKSITKLCHLQTLNLNYCRELKELPEELSRLVKLRTLFTRDCSKLTCFPKGMGELKDLHRLSDFIVGGEGSDSTTKQWFDGLEDLKAMNNLKGRLEVQFKWPKNVVKVADSRSEGQYLNRKEHLKGVTFRFCHQEVDGGVDTEEATRFMEELEPHSNLERLEIIGYRGVRMPSWITLIPKLVRIDLEDCKELEFMPLCLGNLQHLKELWLKNLPKLEYIEINPSGFRSECAQGVSIFPSLKLLYLSNLPKLKALGDDRHLLEDNKNMQLCLSKLTIKICPELTSIPRCLKVEYLYLYYFNNRLEVLQTKRDEKIGEDPPSLLVFLFRKLRQVFFFGKLWQLLFGPENSSKSSCIIPIPTLKEVTWIDNVMWLKSLPMVAFQSIESLSFTDDGGELESFEELEVVFRNCSSSLQNLNFYRCERLRSVCGGLEHLTALKELAIGFNCPNVRLSEETENGKPWRSLHHSLRKLEFNKLPQLVSLPDWMQSLSALEILEIHDCKRLESIPNWMPKLTSLNRLQLVNCSESLKSRCQKDPPGEDWPYIKHIPIIKIREEY